MANVLVFEVEIGNRTVVFGGFSTNGWVERLRTDTESDNSDSEQAYQNRVIQGSGGSFLFNLTDNMRFNAVETYDFDYYTKA